MGVVCSAAGDPQEGSTVGRSRASESSLSSRVGTLMVALSSLFRRACQETSSDAVSLSLPKPVPASG